MDSKDYQILEILIDNARLSNREIAKRTEIPVTTVLKRIKKMEEQKIIKRYTTKIDHEKIGLQIVAYVLINTNFSHVQNEKTTQTEIAKKLTKYPFISCISTVAGRTDILLRVRARDIKQLNSFVTKIAQIKGIDNTETLVVLDDVTRDIHTHKELIQLMRDKEYAHNLLEK